VISALAKLLSRAASHPRFAAVSTLAIATLAAIIRFSNLATPNSLVFDETYYVKDAYTLGLFGSERSWPENANQSFESGDPNVYDSTGSYVVHPPLGKWLIWLGISLFGVEHSFSWRLTTALLGTLSVVLVIAIARLLTKSAAFAAVAGFLLALEGLSIVMSRTAILDGILTFFTLLALLLLLIADRAWRERLRVSQSRAIQPWLIALGASLGMAGAVKWSAIYILLAFGFYTFWSDWQTRKSFGLNPLPAIGQGLINATTLAVSSLALYLVSWLGWISDDAAWGKQLAANWWSALWSYHLQIFEFHANLQSDHPYQANAFAWLLNLRPTAFYFKQFEGPESCGLLDSCTIAITAMPNLLIWFGGLLATAWLIRHRLQTRAGQLILLGFLGAWLPWVFLLERTAFQFYAVLIAPFFILALTLVLQHYWRRGLLLKVQRLRERRITGFLLATSLLAIFYLPLWIGLPVPYDFWRWQLLLPIWI
jgi:dolichyl-phosphate-mannose--protein O-mannosyl transferase